MTAFAEDLRAIPDATQLHSEFVGAIGWTYSLLQLVSETGHWTATDQIIEVVTMARHAAKKEHLAEILPHLAVRECSAGAGEHVGTPRKAFEEE